MKTRKIPIGWRRMTPTEKITAECRYASKSRYKESNNMDNINWWSECIWTSEHGKPVSASIDADNYVYITPIKPKPTTSP